MMSGGEISFENVDVVLVIAGAVFLLAGWLLYWVSLNIAGGMIGGGVSLVLCELMLQLTEDLTPLQQNLIRGGGFLLGLIVGVLLVRWLHRLAFFVAGSLLGGAAFFLIVSAFRELDAEWAQGDALLAFGTAIAGAVAGAVCVASAKFIIALCTAAIGAVLIMQGIGWPWHGLPVVPIALAGFAFQLGLAKPWRRALGGKKYDPAEDD
ncbi:DUF4203 domain-containing protein [Candidatus Sumerlaeota bacterium]|nr:DUF4203 domain-containing protein [Candidatus Sumerlaeota bacterium]